jgi:hypothetical protein
MTKNKALIGLLVVTIVAIAAAVYFYVQYAALKANPLASEQNAQQQVNNLVAKVGALMVLPTGEVPTVATVADPSALKSQAFFANVVAGDKVLVYSVAGEAILYDPSTNKIVNVAPINTSAGNQPAPSATGQGAASAASATSTAKKQ